MSPISEGGMGAVFVAHDHRDGRDVAVKRLLDWRQADRFAIEAELLEQLSHPRVVPVLDHFTADTGSYLVMELVQGTDLAAVLHERGGPGLPVAEVVEYGCQAAEALRYIHDQQVVHRDVKPQNLMHGAGGIVLVDFGIARAIDDGAASTINIGTPGYIAPEIAAGGEVSPAADVYGLAATMWALITGSPPSWAHPQSLRRYEGATPELERVLLAGLDPLPERRIASADALARALGSPLNHRRGTPLAVARERPSAPRELLEAVVRAAAGVFDAAASSIALVDPHTGELVYEAAWGAGSRQIVGTRLAPGEGIAGSVARRGESQAIPDCRSDPRFAATVAAATHHIPRTMLAVPLRAGEEVVGVLSVLDRRSAHPYVESDVRRAELFAELAVVAFRTRRPPAGGTD
jgi:putative methionine-R-sulfoxide reductase with GAF domain